MHAPTAAGRGAKQIRHGRNAYRDQVNAAVRVISAANPEIVKAHIGFSHANAKLTHIDTKTRELIALAVAVTLRRDGCINAHPDAAIKTGASKEEIVDALGVAIMVNAGEVALRRRAEVLTKSGRPCSIFSR